jgi:protein TonB
MEPKKNPAKDVHRYSKQYFLIGLIISCSIAIMAFEWTTEIKKIDCRLPDTREPSMTLYPVPVTTQEDQPIAKPFKKIQVLDLSKLTPDIPTSEQKDDEPIDLEPVENNSSTGIAVEIETEVAIDTFIFVQNMPVPVNGYEGFYKQISKAIKYPTLAKRMDTEGKVFVEFVIDERGNPINLKVTKGIGHGCDEEAKRVISMTKWEPGKQRGKPVLVKMTLPIHFRLN